MIPANGNAEAPAPASNVLTLVGGTSRRYHNIQAMKAEIDRRLISIRPLSFKPQSRRWALAEWSRLLTLRHAVRGGRNV